MPLTNEIRFRLASGRCERIMRETALAGYYSHGPRKVRFNLDNVHYADSRSNWQPGEGTAWLFSFGAYGNAYVVAFGSLEDALEDAAATLRDVAPGMFVEPDYLEALADLINAGEIEGFELGLDDLDDDQRCEVMEHAEVDLTYTESGWLASWEWTCREVTPEEIVAFCKNEG